jgi:hypothetical protein
MWGNTLLEYILAMHGVDLVWKPEKPDEEPPF